MPERSIADFPALMFELRAFRGPRDVFDPACRATEVIAPCCGRKTPADTVLDVRAVAGTIVRGVDHDWLCDGCSSRLVRDPANDWTQSKLMERCGAKPETVRSLKQRERVRQMEKESNAAGRPHDITAAEKAARKEIR